MLNIRVGTGWDRHRLETGDGLKIAGVSVGSEYRALGHSDADVALHALVDALLGAAGMGDIGHHFPPGDSSWEDIDSLILLRKTVRLLQAENWSVVNVDLNIIFQSEKLAPYREPMKKSIAQELPENSVVNIKFKTGESVGPVGESRAIEAQAVALLEKTKEN